MSRNRIPSLILRSLACLEGIKASTHLGPTKIQKKVAETYRDRFHLSAPEIDVTREYFSGKRPIPYDPRGKVAPSYLMALELTFKGSSDIFFHPFFNLTLGPLPSNEKAISRSQCYPEVWIGEHRRVGEHAIAHDEESKNEKLREKRSRRGTWEPGKPLSWIHLNMLHLDHQTRNVLMVRSGLVSAWSRAYRDINDELHCLQSILSFDSITAIFCLMLEGAEIGDARRFVAARECLISQLPELNKIPHLAKISFALVELAMWHIDQAYAASYEPIQSKLERYPLTWKSAAYKYWMSEFLEKKLKK
ncbi:hypothetical protein [Herbaspirillum lusitanum]|uniref:hypothetical protein n=1 Tax=Herbaspirillum lusitanum TaxID=213312 RepID=UPI0022373ACD|nr:hypothetical protein [Herbaspirillum lusitanum]